jgi:hypothetical protein
MIEEVLQSFTPYILKGKKLYDEEDVKKMATKIIQKCISKNDNFDVDSGQTVVQYPEAGC